jgi:multidrug efflux pump subunit AcrA (membrane-fusion protein)
MKIKLISLLFILVTLTACGAGNQANQAVPTVVLDGNSTNSSATQAPTKSSSSPQFSGGGVTASGVVASMQEAQLAFSLAGSVQKVYVKEGDQVKVGDLLAELDNASIQVAVDQAQRNLREMTSQAAIAAAEQAVANNQKTYDDAKKKVDSVNHRRTDNVTIKYLQDQLTLAQNALDHARDTYKQTARLSNVDPIRAQAGTNLYNAQQAYNTALGNLNWYANPPSANDVALANADLDAATAALQESKWYLSELKGESIPAEATGMQLAQLQQARDNLKTAQDQLEHTRLRASIAGAISTVNVVAGEFVSPGQAVIGISDVTNLQVETTDLSERDVPRVSVGQNVKVLIESLNKEVTGHVISIAAVSTTLGGDVVYKTTIALDELPEGIRAGMSVTVQYES